MKKIDNFNQFALNKTDLGAVKGGSLWKLLGNLSLAYDIYEASVAAHDWMHKNFGQPADLRGLK